MNKSEKVSTFKQELTYIPCDSVREVVVLALSKVADKFFYDPASSTGKYHPLFACVTKGTINHTKVVVRFTYELVQLDMYKFTDYDKSIAVAAAILHDTCKKGIAFEQQYTIHIHPLLVENLLKNLGGEQQRIWKDICKVVETHMGQFTTDPKKNSDAVLPVPQGQIQRIVHIADYLASRPFINNLYGEYFGLKENMQNNRPVESANVEDKQDIPDFGCKPQSNSVSTEVTPFFINSEDSGWESQEATGKQIRAIIDLLKKKEVKNELSVSELKDIRKWNKATKLTKGMANRIIGKLKLITEGKPTDKLLTELVEFANKGCSKDGKVLAEYRKHVRHMLTVSEGLTEVRVVAMLRHGQELELNNKANNTVSSVRNS